MFITRNHKFDIKIAKFALRTHIYISFDCNARLLFLSTECTHTNQFSCRREKAILLIKCPSKQPKNHLTHQYVWIEPWKRIHLQSVAIYMSTSPKGFWDIWNPKRRIQWLLHVWNRKKKVGKKGKRKSNYLMPFCSNMCAKNLIIPLFSVKQWSWALDGMSATFYLSFHLHLGEIITWA